MSKFKSEKEFLKAYKQTDYKSPSLAADIATFSVINNKEEDYRKLPGKTFSILLIKRGEYPFLGEWALPGGFLREGESIEQAAARELKEETGIAETYLQQLNLFSAPRRDPRGWIVSCGFSAFVEGNTALSSQNDAKEAKWFSITYKKTKEQSNHTDTGYTSSTFYKLSLTSGNIKLSAEIEVAVKATIYSKEIEYKILSSNGLAFDHAKIIAIAINDVRSKLEKSSFAFKFVGELFTLTELQQVYETILDKKLLAANFRRKIAPFVLETDTALEGAGHRPAKLFERNLEAFLKKESYE